MAESAFVRCKDYQGIQFVKTVLEINVSFYLLIFLLFCNKYIAFKFHNKYCNDAIVPIEKFYLVNMLSELELII